MGAARGFPSLPARLLPGSRRLSRAAAEETRAREALAARLVQASHDLRGALSPALLVADALREHQDPAVARAGETVARTVERAAALAHELLALARHGAQGGASAGGASAGGADDAPDKQKADGYQP